MVNRVRWAKPSFVAAAVFLVVVAVLAVWIILTRNQTTPQPSGAAPTTITRPGDTTAPAPTPTVTAPTAPVPGDGVDDVTVAAADVEWRLWNGIALPYSPTHGPGNVHDDIAENYTHTTTGALLAAVHISQRGSYGPSVAIIERQVVDGPGKEALLRETPTGQQRSSLGAPQVVGYRILDPGPDRVDLELAVRVSGQGIAGLGVTLAWKNEDWKAVATLDGDIFRGGQTVPAGLPGFVAWTGVA